jgi:hypothetical protein
MNRFEYIQTELIPNESHIRHDRGIRLYDGEVRVRKFKLKYSNITCNNI